VSSEIFHILLVDDEEDHVELIRRSLEAASSGSLLSVANSLAEAKVFLTDNTPDFMLIDFRLSDGEGFELLPGDVEKRTMPIVVLTGHGDEKMAAAAIKAGAMDYVVKSDDSLRDIPHIIARTMREWGHIVERRNAEAGLTLYREIFSNSNDAIAIIDPEGVYLEQNEAHRKQIGYSDKELKGKTPAIHMGDEAFSEVANQLVNSGKYHDEIASQTKSGEKRQVDLSAFPIKDSDGKVQCFVGIKRDITERKQVEDKIRAEKDFSSSLVNAAQVIVLVLNPDATIRYINPYMEGVSGYKLAEVEGKDWFTTFLPERDWSEVRKLFSEAISNSPTKGNINPIVAKDGRKRIIEWHDETLKEPNGQIIGLLSTGQDITERKQAEMVLHENEERLRLALGAANQAWFDVNVQTSEVKVSPEYAGLIGFEPEDFETSLQNWVEHLHPDDRDTVMAAFQSCLASGGPETMEYRRQTKSGGWAWMHSIGKVVEWDDAKKPVRMIGIHTGISERKHSEEALIASEERFRTIFEGALDGMVLANVETKEIASVNSEICRMLGYSKEELLQLRVMDIHPQEDLPHILEQFDNLFQGVIQLAENIPVKRKDGLKLYTDIKASPINLSGQGYLLGIFRDITQRKQAEKHLQLFHDLIAQANDATFVIEPESGCFLEVNGMAAKSLGYNVKELIGKKVMDISDLPSGFSWEQHVQDVRKSGSQIFEVTHIRKDGSLFPVEVSVKYISLSGDNFMLATARDISERKQAEEIIRLNESRLKEAQQVSHLGSWELDLGNSVLWWSDENYRIFGVEPGTGNTYETFLATVHPDNREFVDKAYTGSVKNRTPYNIEHRLLMLDGSIKWVNERCETHYDEEGKPLRSVGTTMDISERKQAEEGLKEKLDEVERMNTLMVGRELKMEELRQEIKRLKGEGQ